MPTRVSWTRDGERVFDARRLIDGGFEVIVSGQRKGTGSSRETAPQAEKWSGIDLVIAASFAPIHARNNINLGQLMGDYAQLERLQAGEEIPLEDSRPGLRPRCHGAPSSSPAGCSPSDAKFAAGEIRSARRRPDPKRPDDHGREDDRFPPGRGRRTARPSVKPGDPAWSRSTAATATSSRPRRCTTSLRQEYGADYAVKNPAKFAVFEDHLLYADGVKRMAPFADQIRRLRELQNEFQAHTGVRDYSARGRCLAGYLPPGGSRAVRRPGRLHPGHGLPHLHGRWQQRADLRRGRDRVRRFDLTPASPSSRFPSRSASSSWVSSMAPARRRT